MLSIILCVDEMDSYMYQTVGHDGISLYSQSMGLPLYRRVISGQAVVQDKEYSPTQGDEVEDLYSLLLEIKVLTEILLLAFKMYPNANFLSCCVVLQADIDFQGVAVGAILSDYQRIRVENV